jgi:nickel-type superoxide dismutase maturation protease
VGYDPDSGNLTQVRAAPNRSNRHREPIVVRPRTADARLARRPAGARPLVLLLAVAAIGWVVSRSVLRVEVVGDSMTPALAAGDRLVVLRMPGVRQPWPLVGDVVALHDPREPTRVLVKRVASVDRGAGTLEVHGDAPGASTDSRTFGPLRRTDLVGRAVYRYAPPERSSAAPWPGEYHRA